MEKKEVRLKGVVGLTEAVAHLENLVACLKAGKVCVQNCDDHVTLEPTDQVKIEVSASQRESKETFSLKLAWYKAEPEAESIALTITTEEPPQKEDATDDAAGPAAAGDIPPPQ